MKFKSTLIIALSCLLLASASKAQERQNVLKINLLALTARNFSFQYERALTKKSSVALGFSFMPSGSIPLIPTSTLSGDSSGTIKNMKVSGFSFTPEYRWYPGTKSGAPKGFYLAPYVRYAKYSLTSTMSVLDQNTNTNNVYGITASYGGIGAGLMVGAQWLIAGKFSIDWWMFGGQYGAGTASFKVNADFSNLDQASKDQLKKSLDNTSTNLPIGKATGEVTNTSAGINWTGPFAGLRTGLAIGWAF